MVRFINNGINIRKKFHIEFHEALRQCIKDEDLNKSKDEKESTDKMINRIINFKNLIDGKLNILLSR